jgi:hypothetical protein
MKIKTTLLLAATFSLAACSSPEDNAKSLIAEYCDAFKSIDVEALKSLTTEPNLINFPFWPESDRKTADCGNKVKKVSEEKYIFLVGQIPVIVEKVNGDFSITGVNM